MAGDWIKMRTDLYRDPRVCTIADFLMSAESALSRYVSQNEQCDMAVTRNVMRNATVGALVAVWGVARQRGKRIDNDLVLRGVTTSILDDLADLSGFGAAMEAVGWVKQTDVYIVFPNFFEEYNVDPAEEKNVKNAERQRRYRENKRNATQGVTVTLQSNAREEKRREEKIKTPRAKAELQPLPGNWIPSERTVERLASEFKFSNGDAERYVTAFRDACAAKGYRYKDFDAAFSNCVRQDWPKLRAGADVMPAHQQSGRLAI